MYKKEKSAYLYLPPLLSGLALILAFPPFEQGWLAWFALIPLIRFCLQAEPRQALCGGFLFGAPLHLYLNLYLSGVLFAHLSWGLAITTIILLVVLLCFFNALFALAVSYTRFLKSPFLQTAAIPALWVLMEYIRSLGFIGYNVGYLGYTQWHYPAILNIASVFGYWGLPLLAISFQTVLLQALTRELRGKALAAALLVFIFLFGAGSLLPGQAPVTREDTPLRTALIQGCSAPEEILDASGKKAILKRYLDLTRAAVEKDPRVELVLWPETVVELQMKKGLLRHRPEMVQLVEDLDIGVLFGAQLYRDKLLYNSLILLSPEQSGSQVYDKQRLVPFVEFFPMEEQLNKLLDLEDLTLGIYHAGDEITIFHHRGIPLAGVICFESYFGDYTRLFARRGGRHLFVATNDAWFGETIGLEQHAQAAALRAAEMGIGVTQVANSGISISFDCLGREIMRTGKSERGFYILPLDLARRPTLYRRAGDFTPLLCLLLLAGCAAAAALKARCLSRSPAVSRRRRNR